MSVFVAHPDGEGPHPAVIVLQEIYGVTPDIRKVTSDMAAGGFVAAAPVLYHRQGIPETDERATADRLTAATTPDHVIMDCLATVDLLNSLPDVQHGAIGMMGFCAGGRYCFLLATRGQAIRAYAPFYPTRLGKEENDALLAEGGAIQAPMLFFFGDQDQFIPVAAAERIRATLAEQGKDFQLTIYPDAGHAFLRNRAQSDANEAASRDSWARTLAFFREKLAGPVGSTS
jgi:carboxymethylenebutenolidase